MIRRPLIMKTRIDTPETDAATHHTLGSRHLFSVLCYRSIGSQMSVPDVWITGQHRESAEYHALHGRRIERRDDGCYHGPFKIIPE